MDTKRSRFVISTLAVLACLFGGCSGDGGGGNEGVLTFTASGYSVNEDGTPVTIITVHREGGAAAVGVTVSLSDGSATAPSDYDGTPIILSWGANDLADKTLAVPIVDDNNDEPDEFLTMTLVMPTGGAVIGTPGSATLTIIDEDVAGTVQFGDVSYFYGENGMTGTDVTVTRVGGIDGQISVTVTSSDGTANSDPNSVVEPVDYSPMSVTVTFPDQDATPIVIFFGGNIIDDALPEIDEDLTLSLGNPTNGATVGSPASTTVTIFDNDSMLEIPNPAGDPNGFFGTALAKVGRTLFVGAPNNAAPAGRVYAIDPSVPTVTGTITEPFSQQFGRALATDYNVVNSLVAGAASRAYLIDPLFLDNVAEFVSALDGFGMAVDSMWDGRIVVGAPLAAGTGGASGAVVVFDGATGGVLQTIPGEGAEMFGASFANQSGTAMIIGAPGGSGSVHVYGGNPLTLQRVINNPFPNLSNPSPAFGAAVAHVGSPILVGAPDEDTFAPNDGRVYQFDSGGVTTILPPGPIVGGGRFGSNVLVIQDRICVQQQGGGTNATGRVFVFDSSWGVVGVIDDPNPAPNGNFGVAMCEYDGAIVIAASHQPGLVQSGTVFIFPLP